MDSTRAEQLVGGAEWCLETGRVQGGLAAG